MEARIVGGSSRKDTQILIIYNPVRKMSQCRRLSENGVVFGVRSAPLSCFGALLVYVVA
jgi:hypothetical protein